MSIDYIKILKQLENGKSIRDYSQYFSNKDFALKMLEVDPRYLKHFVSLRSNKQVIFELIKNKSNVNINFLEYISDDLKQNIEFAKELLEINQTTIVFFKKEVIESKELINEYFKYTQTKIQFASLLYEKEMNRFLNEIETTDLYGRLDSDLKSERYIIDAYLKNPLSYINPVSYGSLSQKDYNDMDLNIKLLERVKINNFHYLSLLENIKKLINYDNENIKYFMDNYTGIYSPKLMMCLIKTKGFKDKYKHLINDYPDAVDYRSYIREIDLTKKIQEIDESLLNTISNERKKAKL